MWDAFFVFPGDDPSGQAGFGRALTTEAAQPQAPVPAARFCNSLSGKLFSIRAYFRLSLIENAVNQPNEVEIRHQI